MKNIRLFYIQMLVIIVVSATSGCGINPYLDTPFSGMFKKKSDRTQKVSPPAKTVPQKKPEAIALQAITLATLDNRMLLYKQIPRGVSYQTLKQAAPELGKQRNEAARRGLTEAFLPIDVFGYQAKVEFNFKDNILYNYHCSVRLKNEAEVDVVYKKLQKYFSGHFGSFKETYFQEEPHYAILSSHWKNKEGKDSVYVTKQITPGWHSLAWGCDQRIITGSN